MILEYNLMIIPSESSATPRSVRRAEKSKTSWKKTQGSSRLKSYSTIDDQRLFWWWIKRRWHLFLIFSEVFASFLFCICSVFLLHLYLYLYLQRWKRVEARLSGRSISPIWTQWSRMASSGWGFLFVQKYSFSYISWMALPCWSYQFGIRSTTIRGT